MTLKSFAALEQILPKYLQSTFMICHMVVKMIVQMLLFYFKICTDYKTVLTQLVKMIKYSCFTIQIIEKTYKESHIKILSYMQIKLGIDT